MAAKRKASKDNDAADPALESNRHPEINKKVDEMLSVDPPKINRNVTAKPAPESDETTGPEIDDKDGEEATGAPLLPGDLVVADTPKPEKSAVDSSDPETEAPEPEEVEPETEPTAEPPADVVDLPVPDEQPPDALGLEDVSTGQAVDDIVAHESDELLAVHDKETTEPPETPKPARKGIKAFFRAWWRSKRARYITLAVVLVALAAAATIPASRYFILNSAGVRSAASVTVLDENTGQPLKNAEFIVAGQTGKTDTEGTVKLEKLKLGSQAITIKKAGFAEISQKHTLGWGSNPLGEFRLKPVGSQYKINVTDFLSKKPIAKVEASSGDANARSNDKGEIILTVPLSALSQEQIEIQLSGENLRTESFKLATGKEDTTAVEMVPGRKHVFISKRSGTFDLYKVDVDGKNEEKVLAGTGSERPEAIALSVHPTKNIVALVSARDNSRNKDGFVLSSLTMIDLETNQATKVTQSERVQMVGWIDDRLTYVAITEGVSAASPDRHRLMSYDLDTASEKELARTNYFNDILMVDKSVYYTPASYNVNGSVGLFKIKADGSDKKTIYDKEVWNLFRTSYDKLSISMGQEWLELNLSNDVLTRAASAPPILKTRVYVTQPDNSRSLWADERDGKGVLVSYDSGTKADTVLRAQSGLKNPIRWLSGTHIIYRVSNNQETADYALSTEGGEPRKIVDVTDTAGIDRWYYY